MIYFIRDHLSQLIKIGYSHKPFARLANMQVGSPGKLSLIGLFEGASAEEARLHARSACIAAAPTNVTAVAPMRRAIGGEIVA